MNQPIVEKIEEFTRLGKLHEAKQCLLELKAKRLERTLRQPLAALARRLNLPTLALIFLRPVVKPSERKKTDATPLEKLEYAVALSEIGAATEAHKFFNQVSSTELPQVLLYQSFAYFQTWDYKESIPLLKKYIQVESLSDYQRSVGLANLVSAVVFEETEDSTALAEKFVEESREKGYSRNLAYGLQLLAQDAITHKRWDQAEQCLIEADGMITDPKSLDRLFIRKWKAVLTLSKGVVSEGLQILHEVRAAALHLQHWETVRNCDFHEARLTLNKDLLVKNYFGTPYKSLKNRLVKNLGNQTLPNSYVWYPNEKGTKVWQCFNENDKAGLKSGTATYRLAKVLSSDFYRPIPIAEVHALVYPQQYFNPLTSPNRVHKLVGRLREQLSKNSVPVEITEKEGAYQVSLPRGNGIAIVSGSASSRSDSQLSKAIEYMLSSESFTRDDLSKYLKVSRSSAHRLIQEAEKQNHIEKVGTTKSAYYRVISSLKKAA